MSVYELGLIAQVCINVLMGLSVYTVLATGQLNLGSAGFMAVGAYTSALASIHGVSIAIAMVLGVVAASVAGLLLGLPALRVRGIYLAMATFAFGVVVQSLCLVLPWTGQARGLIGIPQVIPGVLYGFTAVAVLVLLAVTLSKFWLRVRSIHDDEFAASMAGLNTTTVKVGMFTLGGALAGLAGGLYSHWFVYIEPGAFSFNVSIFAVLYVIFGGRRSMWGAVIGATVLTLLPEFTRGLDEWRPAFVGAVLLVILVVRPSGILGERSVLPKFTRTKKEVAA
ncbi:branched-chain amino acid ABC transporter permease [Nocardioides eburneiflavus]|uniref:Branched-chain amino acid ABC transporter permease n=1 Tax=Nocardioides eburneiflavus TaxID=2518372 RepID=A0A4Z1CKW1_9ACTN|nr:branched-chain amino acid ABC transporter permease [Nocardioides eburneiflavus]TGN65783.1 branched-chain amino acid ABC transporter permease [Nocardioides eburneiflavus]